MVSTNSSPKKQSLLKRSACDDETELAGQARAGFAAAPVCRVNRGNRRSTNHRVWQAEANESILIAGPFQSLAGAILCRSRPIPRESECNYTAAILASTAV